jgi:predicted MFS family arabinose efflux permease
MGRGLGIMVGALIGGLLFDLQGNYFVAFILTVVLMLVAVGCMWEASFPGS